MTSRSTSHDYITIDGERLQDHSSTGKKRPWRDKKEMNDQLAGKYDEVNPDKAARLRCCCQELTFATVGGKKTLVGAGFCRVRLCPICTWRRSLKVMAQTSAIVDAIKKDRRVNYLFLTLTARSCAPTELADLITDMMKAFSRLTKYDEFGKAVKGWMRTMEVTHNVNPNSKSYDTYHPHFHVLLTVPQDYFQRKAYLSQEEWTGLWRQALHVDYTPVVHIQRVRGGTGKAIAELAKYATKESDFLVENDHELSVESVRILDSALHKRRFVAYGGMLKEYHKKLHLDDSDQGDLVHVEAEDKPTIDPGTPVYTYFWSGYRQVISC